MLKLFAICFFLSFNLFSQSKFAYQMSILFPEAHLVDIKYTYSNFTYDLRAYPPTHPKEIDKYVFEIKVSVKLNGKDFTWNKPISLEYSTPGSQKNLIILNSESEILDSYQFYDYTFTFETKYSTWLNLNIGEFVSSSYSIDESSEINFSGNSIYIDITPYKL